jgi:drug/metabolite transporter (DMT)-like permease
MFGAAFRFALATILLLGIMALAGRRVPRGRAAAGAVIYGLLGFGLSYALLYIALVELPAGTSSLILAVTPLFTLILAVAHRQESLSMRGLIGAALAVVGITILSGGSIGSEFPPAHLLAALLGAVCIAESSVIVKGFPRTDPITTNAVGMAAGTVLLRIASLVSGEQWMLPATTRTWLVLAWLVVVGSVGLFILFLFVIARWTASATVYALTLMPVVAVTLGALLGRRTSHDQALGGGCLRSSWLSTSGPSPTGERSRKLRSHSSWPPIGQRGTERHHPPRDFGRFRERGRRRTEHLGALDRLGADHQTYVLRSNRVAPRRSSAWRRPSARGAERMRSGGDTRGLLTRGSAACLQMVCRSVPGEPR